MVQEMISLLAETLDNKHSAEAQAKAWEDTAEVVKQYSDEMVQRWNREIDGLLTYVCLVTPHLALDVR